MQRLLVVLAVIAALAGGAAAALSDGGPNAQLVSQDRLYGGGGTDPGCFVPDIGFCRIGSTDFSVDAHATGSGHAAYGDLLFGANHIQVTCLAVDGSKAAVGGIIVSSANSAINGYLGLFFFVDGGPPNAHLDQVSPFYNGPADPSGWSAGFPYVCPSPVTGDPALGIFASYIPVVRGDIVVQDGGGTGHDR
jgi:hypothetical protein